MTEQEKAIKDFNKVIDLWANAEDTHSDTMKIKIDQEFINSLCVAISSLAKQTPKKPVKQEIRPDNVKIGVCYACEKWWLNEFFNYCPKCGQKINWGNYDV